MANFRQSTFAKEELSLNMTPRKLVFGTGGQKETKHNPSFQRCDDGSDGHRGFVTTPTNDTDWPVCKYGRKHTIIKEHSQGQIFHLADILQK